MPKDRSPAAPEDPPQKRWTQPILQKALPLKPWMTPIGARLPGLSPIHLQDWLLTDDVFAEQMAYRDQLIRHKQASVFACQPEAEAGARELLECLKDELPAHNPAYQRRRAQLTRPDGLTIDTSTSPPLLAAGRLAQEDFALLDNSANGHTLVGGLICFPAFWQLADKLGQSLAGVHRPITAFTENMAARTDHIFTHLRPEQPLMRANFLIYTNPDLHQPAREGTKKVLAPDQPRYVRVERQTLRRLPQTGLIIFAIHTFILPAAQLTSQELTSLARLRPEVLQ